LNCDSLDYLVNVAGGDGAKRLHQGFVNAVQSPAPSLPLRHKLASFVFFSNSLQATDAAVF
jgi:hypothetical protein